MAADLRARPAERDPREVSAERRILAAVLAEPEQALPIVRDAGLRPSDLADPSYSAGIAEAYRIADSGMVPDITGVLDAIEARARSSKNREPERVRLRVFEDLQSLAGEAGTVAGLSAWTSAVLIASARRRATGILEDAYDRLTCGNGHETPEAALADEIRHLVDDLTEIRDLAESRGIEAARFQTREELDAMYEQSEMHWLVEGIVAVGEVTLIAASPKAGKSTLTFALLAALERGEPFAGFPVSRCRAVYVSEETASLVLEKAFAFDLRHTLFHVREDFRPELSFEQYIRAGAEKAVSVGARVLVIDTFARFSRLGHDAEKDAGAVEAAITPALLDAASHGLAVILIHHHRKAEGEFGDQVRGSSALLAAVDTLVELRRMDGADGPVRIIECQGRHSETPTEPVSVELRAGRYIRLGPVEQIRKDRTRESVLAVLRAATDPITKDEVIGNAKGRVEDLRRALKDAIRTGDVLKTGRGRPGDPYLYQIRTGGPGGPGESGPGGPPGPTGGSRPPTRTTSGEGDPPRAGAVDRLPFRDDDTDLEQDANE